MSININTLTLGEVAAIEDLSGLSISSLSDEDKPKGKALAALAYVAKRRAEPTFSWNQAQALTFDEVTEILGLDDGKPLALESEDADPKAPSAKRATK